MKVTLIYLKQLAIPVIMILAGALLTDFLQNTSGDVIFIFTYLPYVVFGVSALLCIQFNQSRMLFSLLIFASVYLILHVSDFSLSRLHEFILFFLALINLSLLAQAQERSVLSIHSLIKIAFLCFQIALVWYFLTYQFLLTESIFYSFALGAPPAGINVSWLLLATIALVLLATSLRFILKPDPIIAAQLVLVLVLINLLVAFTPQALVMAMAISGSALVFMAVQMHSHRMAYRDELTGLRSRRALNQYLTGLGRKYTIAMVDIDHFKNFNDQHGHDVGDQMLKLVASRIARVTGGGMPFRYGGEEFTIVFPRKDIKKTKQHLESLRKTIESYPLTVRDKNNRPSLLSDKKPKRTKKEKTLSCTISIGLAARSDKFRAPVEVIKGADEALYRAKNKGRNCLSA